MREGGRSREKEGGREGRRKGERKGEREGGREGEREDGGRGIFHIQFWEEFKMNIPKCSVHHCC